MAITTITEVGSFTDDVAKQINDNFTSLSGSTAGGTLTSAHLLIGSAGNVATDKAVSGDATLANTGAVTVTGINGSAIASTGAQIDALPTAVATGYKIARGITALDGSNPTPIATGLTTITGFAVALNRSTAVSSGTAFVTYGTITAGSVDVYGWVLAGSASTGTENVAWVAVGT